jgi:hypothetical protein
MLKKTKQQVYLYFLILLFGFFITSAVLADNNAIVRATIKISVCGDNNAEENEYCDGTDLKERSCSYFGFSSGTLSCRSDCTFNTSSCITSPQGGGGGGSFVSQPATTTVNFAGRAYPKSTITLLKDAQVVSSVVADGQASFQMSLSGLSGGNYIFSLYGEDIEGNRSSLLTFPVSIIAGTTTNVSNIFIAPTIGVDKSEVKYGENITIFGQSAPSTEITIIVNSDEDFFVKAISDSQGAYLYKFDTTVLEKGQHSTKSKASLNGDITAYGKAVNFIVGSKTVLVNKKTTIKKVKDDLNSDGKINIVDFSIMAYWYKRKSPPAIVDLNGDGKVNIVDFSIMAYGWTG